VASTHSKWETVCHVRRICWAYRDDKLYPGRHIRHVINYPDSTHGKGVYNSKRWELFPYWLLGVK
jgi:hypothetical protein